MIQPQIIALRCPSCGSGIERPSREMAGGFEFRCDGCGTGSVLIAPQAPESVTPRVDGWQAEAKALLAAGDAAGAIRVVHKANKGMSLHEAKVMVDSFGTE